jgi:hypothetical protein
MHESPDTKKNGGTQKTSNQTWLTENIRPAAVVGIGEGWSAGAAQGTVVAEERLAIGFGRAWPVVFFLKRSQKISLIY